MIQQVVEQTEKDITTIHQHINHIVEKNQKRVLDAFKNNRVSDSHFNSTSGYGYDDMGRDTLEAVYAEVFGGESAIVRPQLVSGTHAITTVLFGLLRPQDELLYVTGKPYDTLEEVIGKNENNTGSLKDFNITYNEVPLTEDGKINYELIKNNINNHTKVVAIQRSKGYADRPSFTVDEIGEIVSFVKSIREDIII